MGKSGAGRTENICDKIGKNHGLFFNGVFAYDHYGDKNLGSFFSDNDRRAADARSAQTDLVVRVAAEIKGKARQRAGDKEGGCNERQDILHTD
jgi:hypothetical protein